MKGINDGGSNWVQRVAALRNAEDVLAEERQRLVDEMARDAHSFYDGLGPTAAARRLSVPTGHISLITRLLGEKKASTGFLKELAPGLDRELGVDRPLDPIRHG